jgi:hypothetical protein
MKLTNIYGKVLLVSLLLSSKPGFAQSSTSQAAGSQNWPNAYKIERFDVDKVVMHGDEVVIITNGWTMTGHLFRNSDYFKLKDEKIISYECFFGPGINYPNNSAK